jgi:RecA-family ATPase
MNADASEQYEYDFEDYQISDDDMAKMELGAESINPSPAILPSETPERTVPPVLVIDTSLPNVELPPMIMPSLHRGDYGLLTAAGGTGKSFFAMTWAIFRMLGLEFWADKDLQPVKRVTLLAFEEHPEMLKKRLYDILRMFSSQIKNPDYVYSDPESPKFIEPLISQQDLEIVKSGLFIRSMKAEPITFIRNGEPDMKDIEYFKRCIEPGSDLVIADPVIKVGGYDENSNNQAGIFASWIDKVAADLNTAILFVHHTSKKAQIDGRNDQSSSRGASAVTDEARAVYPIISKDIRDDNNDSDKCFIGLELANAKLNYISPQPPKGFYKISHGVIVPNLPQYKQYKKYAIESKNKKKKRTKSVKSDGIFKFADPETYDKDVSSLW